MKGIKMNVFVILTLIISFSLLVGCTSPKLPENFDEDEVKEAAKEVIEIVKNKDSEGLREKSNVDMRKALTDETLDEIFEQQDEFGEFEEIEDITIGGHVEKTTEEEFAVAVVKTKHENKKVVYNMTFTKQMKLAGLYYK